ncbi:MAG TPA: CHAT domain-containing protein, partial [Vicinamibacterales bacterium]|nr:CHAT domain-containing protein [Vicinamibacterales bacterium]
LAVLQAESGDSAAAFTTVERRRAHALRIAVAANDVDIHRGMTDAERDEERRLAIDLITVAAQIRNETALPHPDSARVARLNEQLASAKAARTAARRKLFSRLPMLAVWRGLGGPADAAEALSAVMPDAPLLAEFVVNDEDILVVMIGKSPEGTLQSDAYVAHVESRNLTDRITHALQAASLRDADNWRSAAADLVKLFPSAAWERIAAAPRVLIVPDDVLWHVPFEALPVEGGVLGDRTAVQFIASATSLLPSRDDSRGASGALLAVASPELAAASKDRMIATAPDWPLRVDAAPIAESQAVAAAAGAPEDAVVTGSSATETTFRERAPSASMLHIAAPFRVNGASPLFSPILLGGDGTATADRDGMVEARELFDLSLHARFAVFTDGAALSMRAAAPAAAVVQWAWRAAGVPAIIVPRWQTAPAAATALLEEFYKQVKEGIPIDAALQRARAAVRANEDTRAPIFWAGWMLLGPPERTEMTERAERGGVNGEKLTTEERR